MAKLTAARLQADIDLLRDFRARLERFQSHRQKLQQLKQKVEGNWMMGMDLNAAENVQKDLVNELMSERQEIGKRLHDVKEITDRYPLRTELVIMPPRLIGGYSSKMNLFEAFIQLQLPHDFQMDPIPVYDVVDQAIWACERELRDLGPQKAQEALEGPTEEGVQATQEALPASGSGGLACFTIVTGLATLVGLIGLVALCPKPAIDRDITLDERNPFEMQFRVRNGSAWFDLYDVRPACELLKVEIGNVAFPKGAMVYPDGSPYTIAAGGSSTFPCHLSPQFRVPAEGVKSADVNLIVNYKWFNRFGSAVKQRIVLTRDKSGKPVWLFTGTKD
jgi:hypothetical protein